MARSARRYDIYLPLAYNDGRVIPKELFVSVEQRLLARFGDLTSLQRKFPLRGIWQGESRLYLDQVIIITVLDFRRGGSGQFIARLKRSLICEFDQPEILIIGTAIRVY